MEKENYDNPAMRTANADMDLPPPYHLAVLHSTQALSAYHGENTTDIVQVKRHLGG